MQKFKSKAPDLIGFQWVEGVILKDELVELIGSTNFDLSISGEDFFLMAFLKHKDHYMDIFLGDWVVKYPNGSILSIEQEELNETYVKVP